MVWGDGRAHVQTARDARATVACSQSHSYWRGGKRSRINIHRSSFAKTGTHSANPVLSKAAVKGFKESAHCARSIPAN